MLAKTNLFCKKKINKNIKNILKNIYFFFLMLISLCNSSYNVFLESFGLGKISACRIWKAS